MRTVPNSSATGCKTRSNGREKKVGRREKKKLRRKPASQRRSQSCRFCTPSKGIERYPFRNKLPIALVRIDTAENGFVQTSSIGVDVSQAIAISSSDNPQNTTLHYTTNENTVLDFVQREQTPEFGMVYLLFRCMFSKRRKCNEIELARETRGRGWGALQDFRDIQGVSLLICNISLICFGLP